MTTSATRLQNPKQNRQQAWICALLGLLGLATQGIAQAHDFWLEAEPYQLQPGQSGGISAQIGMDFQGQRQIAYPGLFDDFSLIVDGQRRAVESELGDDPVGHLRLDKPGVYVVGAHATRRFVELPAEKFNHYLKMEGLDPVIDARQKAGNSDQGAREYYSRYVKTLIEVKGQDSASPPNSDIQQRFGYRLEMTPLNNPYRLKLGDSLRIQLEYQGQPIEGLLVVAITKDQPKTLQTQRSDAQGQATIHLDRPGIWLIKAVHMVPYNGDDADWESFWSSLSFKLNP